MSAEDSHKKLLIGVVALIVLPIFLFVPIIPYIYSETTRVTSTEALDFFFYNLLFFSLLLFFLFLAFCCLALAMLKLGEERKERYPYI